MAYNKNIELIFKQCFVKRWGYVFFATVTLPILGCGESGSGGNQNISLKKIQVQESSGAISGDFEEAKESDASPADGANAIPQPPVSGGKQDTKGNPSSDTSAPPPSSTDPTNDPTVPPSSKKETDSVAAFTKTVFPLADKWCGGACHVKDQAPIFANSDKTLAHDSVLTTNKVDFNDIPKSRLVLRLSQDNHNCPSEGCASAANQMIAAIQEWNKQITDSVATKPNTPKIPTTTTLQLSAASATRMDSGLPPGTLLFEAEKGVLKAPMVALAVPTASGGMVVHTPAGAGSQTNIQTAETSTTLGGVTFDFDVLEAGSYRLIGKINAPANANSSFYIKMDGAPLLLWDFPTSAANYVFDVADAAAAAGTAHLFNLPVGKHKLEIRQREEQTKLDSVIMTIDTGLDPASVKPVPREVKTLSFDLADLTGVSGAKLNVDVTDYSTNAYMFKNPQIILPSGSFKVKGLKLYVNGKYLPQNATYTTVDAVVKAPGMILSSSALVAVKDKGPDMDQFSFSFETLEKSP